MTNINFLEGSYHHELNNQLGDSHPVVGQIKTIRTQNPQDHGNWHLCPDPSTSEPRVYSKVEYPELFLAIGARMNASVTDPLFNPSTHFAGPVTQLGYTGDDYWDFIYVGKKVEV